MHISLLFSQRKRKLVLNKISRPQIFISFLCFTTELCCSIIRLGVVNVSVQSDTEHVCHCDRNRLV